MSDYEVQSHDACDGQGGVKEGLQCGSSVTGKAAASQAHGLAEFQYPKPKPKRQQKQCGSGCGESQGRHAHDEHVESHHGAADTCDTAVLTEVTACKSQCKGQSVIQGMCAYICMALSMLAGRHNNVDEGVCLDSAATVHVLSNRDSHSAVNVRHIDPPHELHTAGGLRHVCKEGDCEVAAGLEVKQGWIAPWMNLTLLSLTQFLKQGYTMCAWGDTATLTSPEGHVHEFKESEGLFKPCVSNAGGSRQVAYKTAGRAFPKLSGKKVLAGAVACMMLLAVEHIMGGPTMSSDVVKIGMPMLSLLQSTLDANGTINTVDVPVHKPSKKHTKLSALEHARRGHCPHDDTCEVSRMARMRAPKASRTDGVVADADKGYVLGIDYAGPFDPDVDGNTYALVGVEVGHTNYGMVELQKDRTSAGASKGVKAMLRELHTIGPDPKEVVRLHSDNDKSFAGELEAELLDAKVRQTNTGGYRPTNNSRTEKRIGLVLYSLRAMLYTATGGGRYYDQLWGPGLKHACRMVNVSEWSDGKSPYAARVGKPYVFDKHDHVFGAKALYYVNKEHRNTKLDMPGQEAIWVGRSAEVPGAHVVVPYTWDAASQRYVLGSTVTVARADVDDNVYPLRMGPNDVNDTKSFDEFMDAFHHQMYGAKSPSDFAYTQTDPVCCTLSAKSV